jgi:hypothetical protein
VELLNKVVSDCFTRGNNICPQLPRVVDSNDNFSNIIFTPDLVPKSIKHMKAKSEGGPDGIPLIFFKECSLWLYVSPLHMSFKHVLKQDICHHRGMHPASKIATPASKMAVHLICITIVLLLRHA